jgi:molybdenum cofactor cytidylyltransferase
MATRAYGALVLAAGRGVRVGGPKALLVVRGAPLALLHAQSHAAAERVLLVLNEEVAPILAPLVPIQDRGRVRVLVNRLPSGWGPAASLRVASGELDACERWIVGPVDALPATAETIARLVEALGADGANGEEHDAARFTRGHPIAARASLLRGAYAGEGEPPPLRDVLASARVRSLGESVDPAVTTELDTIEDVVRVTGAAPRFVG